MFAFAFGLANRAADGTVLDVFFPAPVRGPDATLAATVLAVVDGDDGTTTHEIDDAVLARLAAGLDAADRGRRRLSR